MGRTKRIRKRNSQVDLATKICSGSASTGFSKAHENIKTINDEKFIKLMQWAKQVGFDCKFLYFKPAVFPGIGRGAMAMKAFCKNSSIITVPKSLLITTETVMQSSLSTFINANPKRLNPLQALCLFLLMELEKQSNSHFFHYLNVLPQSYDNAAYWTEDEIHRLPQWVKNQAIKHQKKCMDSFEGVKKYLHELQKLFILVDYERYRWAWSTVNTRAVYWSRPLHANLDDNDGEDHFALAPILDLLNHSSEADVQAGYNQEINCYQISTRTRYKKWEQIFINYGPHDNAKLLVEYGFILPINPHDHVPVYLDKLVEEVKLIENCSMSTSRREQWIREKHLQSNLSFSMDGISWNLQVILKVLACGEHQPLSKYQACLMNNLFDDGLGEVASRLCKNYIKSSISELEKEWPNTMTVHDRMAKDLCDKQKYILMSCLEQMT